MFDLVNFAKDKNLTVMISAFANEDLVCIGLIDADNLVCTAADLFMVKQPDETDNQYEERFMAFIMRQYSKVVEERAKHTKNAQLAKQREEIEKMFRGL